MKKPLMLVVLASVLQGIHRVNELAPVVPVEMVIPLLPNQTLFKLDLNTFWVEPIPVSELVHDSSGYSFPNSKVEPDALYYPALNITHAVRHFQKYLDKFYAQSRPTLPVVKVEPKPIAIKISAAAAAGDPDPEAK